MAEFLTTEALTALFQVIMIDLVLAGDNAIVIGLAAAGLPAEQRPRAILVGIAAATVLRIAFAGVATQLLADPGPAAGRRRAALVGVLEDVARVTARRITRPTRTTTAWMVCTSTPTARRS